MAEEDMGSGGENRWGVCLSCHESRLPGDDKDGNDHFQWPLLVYAYGTEGRCGDGHQARAFVCGMRQERFRWDGEAEGAVHADVWIVRDMERHVAVCPCDACDIFGQRADARMDGGVRAQSWSEDAYPSFRDEERGGGLHGRPWRAVSCGISWQPGDSRAWCDSGAFASSFRQGHWDTRKQEGELRAQH